MENVSVFTVGLTSLFVICYFPLLPLTTTNPECCTTRFPLLYDKKNSFYLNVPHIWLILSFLSVLIVDSLSSMQRKYRRTSFVNSLITACKRSLEQGNMFTGVCLSTGGRPLPGGCLLLGGACSGGVPGGPPDGYRCGRYASHWNAFLFLKFFYRKER